MTRLSIAVLSAALLLGCSGIKPYPDTSPKNLRVQSQVEGAVAEVDVYRVDADCRTEYRGRVSLDRSAVEFGLPSGSLHYLDFIFASKTFLSPSVNVVRYETLLLPRPERRYDVQVRYVQSIYSVVIRETAPGGSTGRVIERGQLSDCVKRARL